MKVRAVKKMKKVLRNKGFVVNPEKDHHEYYVLEVDGKLERINTYFSHGKKEYGRALMGEMKKQLKFENSKQLDDFFDCPMSKEDYVLLQRENGNIQ